MTHALEGLYKYQRDNFIRLSHNIRDFDLNAYPETATKYHLEKMATYMKIDLSGLSVEEARSKILQELSKPLKKEENTQNGIL